MYILPTQGFHTLMKYVLKNNVFQFDEYVLTQLCCVAMGKKLALALATIYIGKLEETFIESTSLKPKLSVRYIGYVLLIRSNLMKAFDDFLEDLNIRQKKLNSPQKLPLNLAIS